MSCIIRSIYVDFSDYKVVFANQLKTVISNVLTGVSKTDSDIIEWSIFSYNSIANFNTPNKE